MSHQLVRNNLKLEAGCAKNGIDKFGAFEWPESAGFNEVTRIIFGDELVFLCRGTSRGSAIDLGSGSRPRGEHAPDQSSQQIFPCY